MKTATIESKETDVNLASEMWHRLELFSEGKPDDLSEIPIEDEFLEAGSEFLPAGEKVQRFYKALLFHFGEFGFLEEADLKLRWKLKGGKSGGNETLGKLQKPSGLLLHFSKADYVVWFAADHCRERNFTNWQILALLYHELCHATQDENGMFTVRGHEYEGFFDELKLFGGWRENAKAIISVAQKLPGFE